MSSKNSKNIIIAILIIVVCLMAVGYAAISSSLTINGTAKLQASSWNVYINNISLNKNESLGTYSSNNDNITLNGTTATFNASLTNPGSFVVYDISVKNDGSLGAVRSNFNSSDANTLNVIGDDLKYITVNLSPLETDNHLASKTGIHHYKLTIKYNNVTTNDPLPDELNYTITAKLNYVQA